MIRRIILVCLLLLALGATAPLTRAAAQGRQTTNRATSGDTCSNTFKSASGATVVSVCPTVVESGQTLTFTVHGQRGATVTVTLQYPNGVSDSKTDTADDQGVVSIDMVVRYNPLYRYGQAKFQVTDASADGTSTDTVSGTVRIAQSTSSALPRLRVQPAGAKDWCPEDGRCVVRDNSTILIRVDTDPNAQVQVDLAYPNGVTLPCPGNSLTGNSGAFADDSGVFECKMPVYYDLPNARTSVPVVVEATVTTSTDTIPVQYKLWLKGK